MAGEQTPEVSVRSSLPPVNQLLMIQLFLFSQHASLSGLFTCEPE